MVNLAKRNFIVYTRDRAGVFFSFLGVLIIIALYLIFLGENMEKAWDNVKEAGALIDTWVMAGILAVASITTAMGACAVIVDDRIRKTAKDFRSAPMKSHQITGSYMISTLLSSFVMTVLTLIAAELYLFFAGAPLLSAAAVLKVLGVILLTVFASCSIVLFVVSFLKTMSAYSNVSILLGTLIGFVTGMYIPIGTLSEGVQLIIKLFPISHGSALFRRIMLEDVMRTSFEGAPESAVAAFESNMGVVYQFGDTEMTVGMHVLVLVATTVIFFLFSLLRMSRKAK